MAGSVLCELQSNMFKTVLNVKHGFSDLQCPFFGVRAGCGEILTLARSPFSSLVRVGPHTAHFDLARATVSSL